MNKKRHQRLRGLHYIPQPKNVPNWKRDLLPLVWSAAIVKVYFLLLAFAYSRPIRVAQHLWNKNSELFTRSNVLCNRYTTQKVQEACDTTTLNGSLHAFGAP